MRNPKQSEKKRYQKYWKNTNNGTLFNTKR